MTDWLVRWQVNFKFGRVAGLIGVLVRLIDQSCNQSIHGEFFVDSDTCLYAGFNDIWRMLKILILVQL